MIRVRIKKKVVLLLVASMLSGLSLSAADGINVHAENTTSEPSLWAYASKKKMMEEFEPESGNIGKIKFGKDSEGYAQEWYILGRDSGVSTGSNAECNTAIFASNDMISYFDRQGESHSYRTQFNPAQLDGEIDFKPDGSMGTYISGSPKDNKIFRNHYGASNIREKLIYMENNTDYFSSAEQSLMQATTVRTDDFRGTSVDEYLYKPNYYETSDKLYLGAWDYNGDRSNKPELVEGSYKFYIGSETGKKILSWDKYWNSTSNGKKWNFWLRSPYHYTDGDSLPYLVVVAYTEGGFYGIQTQSDRPNVRPASNLNLSTVLFASAATAADDSTVADSIADGSAMSLRLDGSDKNIGSVKASTEAITVERGTTGKKVALVVQGKGKDTNQEVDWYYSTVITGTGTTEIGKDTIKTELKQTVKLEDDLDLKNCKTWLEITDDDGMLYAVDANSETGHTHTYDGWTTDETDHWQQCTPSNVCPDLEDSIKDKDGHTFNENGHCTVCGYDVSVDDWEYKKPVAATCKDNGKEEYWIYNVNGNIAMYRFTGKYDTLYLGAQEKKLEKFTDMDEIKTNKNPDNHVNQSNDKPYAKEYVKVNASTHKITCNGCGAELGMAAHNFVGNKCNDCGYTKNSSNGGGGGSSGSGSYSNTGWIKDNRGWRYRNSNGTLSQGGIVTDVDGGKIEKVLWQKIGSGYFAFGSDTYLVTGWIYDKLEDKWYYCDENLGKLYGWYKEPQDGYWYYLSTSTGEALTGWQSINGKSYYFASAPSAPTYSYDAATGFWIYSNISGVRPFGSMYASTVTPDNYAVDASGAWVH